MRTCKRNHTYDNSKHRNCPECRKAYKAKYRKTPEAKAYQAAYQLEYKNSPKGKASRKAYKASPKGKAARAAYQKTAKAKAYNKKYNASPKAKATRANKLITLHIDGKPIKLWGLVLACRDKRQRWQADMDYIPTLKAMLKSSDSKKVKEAQDALLFLNASILAILDGNFKPLNALGVVPSDELKKEVYNNRNATQREISAQEMLTPEMLNDAMSIGELAQQMKDLKSSLKDAGVSINDFRQSQESKDIPLPIKRYTPEELKKINENYFKKTSKF